MINFLVLVTYSLVGYRSYKIKLKGYKQKIIGIFINIWGRDWNWRITWGGTEKKGMREEIQKDKTKINDHSMTRMEI